MYRDSIRRYLQRHGLRRIGLKAVLIDMDGVLYDSMRNHTQAWYRTVSERGIACTPEEFYLYEGRTGASTINLFYNRELGRDASPEEIRAMYRRKSDLFNALPKALPMPGAALFLTRLQLRGLRPVLVTGSGQDSLLEKLNRDYPGVFVPEYMVTAFDVKYGKPHPEPYLMGLQKAGVQPGEALVVENAPLGVQAGTAAGIFTVGVNTGPLPDKVLLEAGADLLLHSMQELADRVDSLCDELLCTTAR